MAQALPCSSGINLSPSCSSLASPFQSKLKTFNSSSTSSRLQNFEDLIEEIESNHSECHSVESDIASLPDIDYPLIEPIIIRGNGNMTLFGLSNTFSTEFPNCLIGHVSREEFEATMSRINNLLRNHHSTNAKLLIIACLCCCCSFGCSLLWPTIALSKRTRSALEKLLSNENNKLYYKLGLNWRLSKERCSNNHSFMEYILIIDFLPKQQIYLPD